MEIIQGITCRNIQGSDKLNDRDHLVKRYVVEVQSVMKVVSGQRSSRENPVISSSFDPRMSFHQIHYQLRYLLH